uniref:Uncharacterized protein n=1 Tax=Triticum urartu TaxID=4572 RepID=A0A8R7PZG1_TRIUA
PFFLCSDELPCLDPSSEAPVAAVSDVLLAGAPFVLCSEAGSGLASVLLPSQNTRWNISRRRAKAQVATHQPRTIARQGPSKSADGKYID